jgi:hypothetical protein
MLLGVAIHQDLTIFKVDLGFAFMRTPMANDVMHNWVQLHKRVWEVLKELQPGKYDEYVLRDGTVIVRMKKLSYGYIEAAHYWWRDLMETLKANGYAVSKKDKCISIKREDEKSPFCGTTVDNCLFICSGEEKWIKDQIGMLKKKYEEITIEHGDEIGLIGMQIQMD